MGLASHAFTEKSSPTTDIYFEREVMESSALSKIYATFPVVSQLWLSISPTKAYRLNPSFLVQKGCGPLFGAPRLHPEALVSSLFGFPSHIGLTPDPEGFDGTIPISTRALLEQATWRRRFLKTDFRDHTISFTCATQRMKKELAGVALVLIEYLSKSLESCIDNFIHAVWTARQRVQFVTKNKLNFCSMALSGFARNKQPSGIRGPSEGSRYPYIVSVNSSA